MVCQAEGWQVQRPCGWNDCERRQGKYKWGERLLCIAEWDGNHRKILKWEGHPFHFLESLIGSQEKTCTWVHSYPSLNSRKLLLPPDGFTKGRKPVSRGRLNILIGPGTPGEVSSLEGCWWQRPPWLSSECGDSEGPRGDGQLAETRFRGEARN